MGDRRDWTRSYLANKTTVTVSQRNRIRFWQELNSNLALNEMALWSDYLNDSFKITFKSFEIL